MVAVRRLYFPDALLILTVAIAGARSVDQALRLLLGVVDADLSGLVRSLWYALLGLAFWSYHFRIAGADRRDVGEQGASATIRRWYAYSVIVIALLVLLFNARELLTVITLNALGDRPTDKSHIASTVARALVSLPVWLFHAGWTKREPIISDDRRSTLRAVAGFGVLAVSVTMVLAQASQALYYG